MNLGFDAKRFFFNNTGLGNYSRTLLYSLLKEYPEHNYFLFSAKLKKLESRFAHFSNLKTISPQNNFNLFWRQMGINKEINENNIQIFHGLSHEIPISNKKNKYQSVLTMHDLIYKIHPELFSKIDAKIYDKKYKSSCNRANKIIAISESTKIDLIKYYGLNESKIDVVYQTCNPIFEIEIETKKLEKIRQENNLPQSFILSVGSIIERKNLFDLVKAIHRMPKNKRIPIVVVGNGKEYLEKIQRFVTKNKLQSYFLHFPYISNDILPAFYQLAKLFVYTSSYEGFGIPILEALYSKTPVICSNVSSLPEAGGNAVKLVSPNNIEELQYAILEIIENDELQEKMIEKGIIHAKTFTNSRMARETMKIYKELV